MGKDNLRTVAIGAALIALSIALPGSGGLIAGLIFSAGTSIAASGVAGAFATDLADRQDAAFANPAAPTASIPVVYGESRVGIALADVRVHPTDEDILYIVGAICVASEAGGGIEDITKIYFDDRVAVNNPAVTGVLGTTGVASFLQDDGDYFLEYAIHLGTDAQTVDAHLTSVFPTQWPATSKGAGIAYVVLKLTYDAEIWPSGVPNITCVVQGNKLYDPRDASTTWKANPALCVRDYLTSTKYGCAIATSEIDDSSFEDAANYCDEAINTTGYSGVRFTCNGVVDTGQSRQQVLNELLSSCRGELVYQGGKFRMVIRQPTVASSFALTEGNIVGDWEFVRGGSDAPNSITAGYIDPAKQYQARQVTWPGAGQANGFLTADNNVLSHASIELPFTTNYYIAEQIGMVAVRETREDITIAVTAKEEALKLQVGDVVPLTHTTPGFTAKEFWVARLAILPNAAIRLVLREYDTNAYTLDTQDTEATVPGSSLPNPFSCAPPTSLVLTSDATTALGTQGGKFVPRILAEWTASPDPFIDFYEVEFKAAADAAFTAWTLPDRLATSTMIFPVSDEVEYTINVRAVNTLKVRSAPLTGTVTASTKRGTPDIKVIPFIGTGGQASASTQGDVDTASVKIAASTTAFPTITQVRLATGSLTEVATGIWAIEKNGRNLTPTDIGNLLTATDGQIVYYAALGYSEDDGEGHESELVKVSEPFGATVDGGIHTIAIALSEPQSNVIQVDVEEIGTAATRWRSWARRGANWPTIDGTETGTLDDRYLVIDQPVSTRMYQIHAENGDWKIIAKAGEPYGIADTATITIAGSPASGAFFNLEVVPVTDAGDFHELRWDHNQLIEDDDPSAYTIDVRFNRGLGMTAATSGRDPELEYDNTTSTPLRGSFRHQVGIIAFLPPDDPAAEWRRYEYFVDLILSAVVIATYSAEISGFYDPSAT